MLGLQYLEGCIVKIFQPPCFRSMRSFVYETLNCFELFAEIKLFGVINKSFYFVHTSVVLIYVAYICILYVDVF